VFFFKPSSFPFFPRRLTRGRRRAGTRGDPANERHVDDNDDGDDDEGVGLCKCSSTHSVEIHSHYSVLTHATNFTSASGCAVKR